MKNIIILMLALSITGCTTLKPIKTTLDLETAPAPKLNYSSEKDVIYSRTSTDPETGIVEQVEFKALASAAAYAQAERDVLQAQINASRDQMLQQLLSNTLNIATPFVAPTTNILPSGNRLAGPESPEIIRNLEARTCQ